MDVTKLEDQVKKIMDEIFSQKEDKDKKIKIEAALVESANAIEALRAEISTFKTKVVELETQLAAANEKETAMVEEVASLSTLLADARACIRVTDLETAGILTNKDGQMKKVRTMSDEEFAEYKDELASIRAAALEEIANKAKAEKEKEEAEAAALADKAAADEAKAKEEAAVAALTALTNDVESMKTELSGIEDSADVAAVAEIKTAIAKVEEDIKTEEVTSLVDVVAQIKSKICALKDVKVDDAFVPPARVGSTEFSAMNFEIFPSDDLFTKYRSMGEAMAKAMLDE